MQNTPTQMQAMAVDEFGGPDKLTMHTVSVPSVGDGQVMVKIEVAGVGVWDVMERAGHLVYNDAHFPRVLGGESAGTIVALGAGAAAFAVGDKVYVQSFMNDMGGSYAEYVVVPEVNVASVPNGMDMLQAGGLSIAGLTAMSNLETLGIGDETRLMLWGASGGVGHVALQLAKRMGARVFAIASGKDGVDLCKNLGADVAVDGHDADVMERARQFAPEGFDKALVLVGGDQVQASLELVRQGGVISYPNGVMPAPVAPDGVELKQANGYATRLLLDQLNTLMGIGDFKVHIAQTFPLQQAAQAQAALDKHYVGKIVLQVNP